MLFAMFVCQYVTLFILTCQNKKFAKKKKKVKFNDNKNREHTSILYITGNMDAAKRR
jgi:hypothetical protein